MELLKLLEHLVDRDPEFKLSSRRLARRKPQVMARIEQVRQSTVQHPLVQHPDPMLGQMLRAIRRRTLLGDPQRRGRRAAIERDLVEQFLRIAVGFAIVARTQK